MDLPKRSQRAMEFDKATREMGTAILHVVEKYDLTVAEVVQILNLEAYQYIQQTTKKDWKKIDKKREKENGK